MECCRSIDYKVPFFWDYFRGRDWQAVEFYPIYKLSYVRCRKPCCWLYPIKKNINNPVVHCWIHPVVGYHQISGGVPLLAHHGWLDHPLKKINWGIIDVCSIYIHTYTCIDIDIYIYYHFIYLFGGCYTGVWENGLIGIHRIARFLSEKMILL